jgi:hypothetical protein
MAVPRLKPFVRWVIYKKYKVRYSSHQPTQISGVLTTPDGEVAFNYDPDAKLISLSGAQIAINDYGWEVDPDQNGDESVDDPGGNNE